MTEVWIVKQIFIQPEDNATELCTGDGGCVQIEANADHLLRSVVPGLEETKWSYT